MPNAHAKVTVDADTPTVESDAREQLQHRLSRSRRAFARRHRALATTLEQAAQQTRAATADYVSFVATEGLRWKHFVQQRKEAIRSAAVERALLVQLHQALEGLQQQVERRVAELDRPTLAGGSTSPPLGDYEAMTARELVDALSELDADTCRAVEAYEQAHKQRVTVLRAARRRLAA